MRKDYRIAVEGLATLAKQRSTLELAKALQRPLRDLATAALLIVAPDASIAVAKYQIDDQLDQAGWPKTRSATTTVRATEPNQPPLSATIQIGYDYMNPRDGDYWNLEVHFPELTLRGDPNRELRFQAQSNTVGPALVLTACYLPEQWIASLIDAIAAAFESPARIVGEKLWMRDARTNDE